VTLEFAAEERSRLATASIASFLAAQEDKILMGTGAGF